MRYIVWFSCGAASTMTAKHERMVKGLKDNPKYRAIIHPSNKETIQFVNQRDGYWTKSSDIQKLLTESEDKG
jgi:hypothetical protein